MIQLHQEEVSMLVVEQRLSRSAIGTVALGEDDDRVVLDDLLCFGMCGRHAGGGCGPGGAEEVASDTSKERQFGGCSEGRKRVKIVIV